MIISDYATSTDNALMVPIQINIDRVQPRFVPEGTLHGVGHVWGHAVEDLLAPLQQADSGDGGGGGGDDGSGEGGAGGRESGAETAVTREGNRLSAGGPGGPQGMGAPQGFDVVIMADLLFNRSQHAQLLETCDRCLRRGSDEGTVWVSFSHHDPEKAELDMKFFALAAEKGFVAGRIKTVSEREVFLFVFFLAAYTRKC